MHVALITGGTAGIGAAFARAFAARGVDLVLVARTLPRLEETADLLEDEFGVPVRVLSADLASEQGIATVVAFIGHERVDVVVNNAGYGLPYSALRSDPAELAALDRVLMTSARAANRNGDLPYFGL